MKFDLTEIILSSPFSSWAAFISVFVLTVGAFSFLTKECKKRRNREAIQSLLGLCRIALKKFEDANVDRESPASLRSQKVAMWFGVAVLCMFSAWMYLYAIVTMGLMVSGEAAGLKATLMSLFALTLVVIANMYRVSARKMRREINDLE